MQINGSNLAIITHFERDLFDLKIFPLSIVAAVEAQFRGQRRNLQSVPIMILPIKTLCTPHKRKKTKKKKERKKHHKRLSLARKKVLSSNQRRSQKRGSINGLETWLTISTGINHC